MGHLRENVSRGGRDRKKLNLLCERDVLNLRIIRRREHLRDYRIAGDRLKSARRDKVRRVPRHHDFYGHTGLLKPSEDLDSLICPNASGHSQRDLHCPLPQDRYSSSSAATFFSMVSYRTMPC